MLPQVIQLIQEFHFFFNCYTKKMVTSLVASVLYQCKTEKGYETKISNTP